MKTTSIIMSSAMIVVGMMIATPVQGSDTHRAALEAIVDQYIAVCEAKSEMLSSNSENIRRDAMRACMRATLARNSKAALIDALIAKNVAPKPYKVHHFLNARFKEVIGDIHLAVR